MERGEAGHDRAVDSKGGHAVGDPLLGVGDHFQDRLTEPLQGGSFWFLDLRQVAVDFLGGHSGVVLSSAPSVLDSQPPVSLQPLYQLVGAAKGGQMTTVHLVRHDPQAVRYYPALELGREESVVPAKQEPGRNFRPPRQRPRLLEGRPGLGPGVTTRLGR